MALKHVTNALREHNSYFCRVGWCADCHNAARTRAGKARLTLGDPVQPEGGFTVAELKVWGYVGLYEGPR